jgi:hypothetical protein
MENEKPDRRTVLLGSQHQNEVKLKGHAPVMIDDCSAGLKKK